MFTKVVNDYHLHSLPKMTVLASQFEYQLIEGKVVFLLSGGQERDGA